MKVYPIFLNVCGRPCRVVGGGEIALQKVRSLLEADAEVRVISPELVPEIEAMAADGRVEVVRRGYRSGDLEGAFLAYAATDDDAVHERIAEEARSRGVLLNVVDRTQWCDFIVPSIARRGDLVVGVSTSGSSPAMARRVRLDIEEMLGPEYESAIEIFSRLRQRLAADGWSFERRKQLFDRLLDSDFLGLLRSCDSEAIDRLLSEHTGEPISVESLGGGA